MSTKPKKEVIPLDERNMAMGLGIAMDSLTRDAKPRVRIMAAVMVLGKLMAQFNVQYADVFRMIKDTTQHFAKQRAEIEKEKAKTQQGAPTP